MFDIAIVGGGASGLACAIEAAKTDSELKIVIIEALPKVGKKLLATGNGRCNLSNKNAVNHEYKNKSFAEFALNTFNVESTIDFFKEMGLICVQDSEGRYYPMSNTAASVLDSLRLMAEALNVEIITDTKVTKLYKKNDTFVINNDIKAKKVVLSCAGMSTPAQGSDGSGYKLLNELGIKVTSLHPSLVQLVCEDKAVVKPLKGVRIKAILTLFKNNTFCSSSSGEILFTDYGISGIAAMDLSRFVDKNESKAEYLISIDAAVGIEKEDVVIFIKNYINNNPLILNNNLLTGIVPKRFAEAVLKKCSVNINGKAQALSCKDINDIAYNIKNFHIKIIDTNGFNNSQVTSGGADVKAFECKTMECKAIKGLYCAGELLDVDGSCGGYNLQWAWSSGRLAGSSAAKAINKQ